MTANLLSEKGFPATETDVVVIGGGPAGIAAAIAALDENASVILIERDNELGGILRQCIHNGFGLHYFGEELTGPEYAARFIDMLSDERKSRLTVMLDTMVLEVKPEREVVAVSKAGIHVIKAKSVVLSMGCRERTRGALNIPGTRPAGVYTAGCAQRLVNIEGYMPGERVVVLGSGDIGLIMARRMTFEGAKVEAVCEIMPYSSGLNRNIVQCLDDYNIPLYLNHTVTQVSGRERVESVTIAEVDENRRPKPETEREIPCDTLLLSVGLIPENELSRESGISMDAVTGGAVVDQNRQTSIEGIFACGNVLHVHDLADNVSDEAMLAGKSAARYAKAGSAARKPEYSVKCGNGVRYAVPQKLVSGEGKVKLYFRVSDVSRNAEIEVVCGDTVLFRRKKLIVTPGEMEEAEIDISRVDGDVEVRL